MNCRVCQTVTIPWLDLGVQPLANGFYTDTPPPEYPLQVERCPSCALSQLTEVVPPELLYTNYPYRSGISGTFQTHCGELASDLSVRFPHKGRALDIASNDGTLLKWLEMRGFGAVGIEPAESLAKEANRWGYATKVGYFPQATQGFASESCQVITSLNVLGHVADVHAFTAEVARLLTDDGVWVVEVPWVRELLSKGEFDTIYHEHLSYWSLRALEYLGYEHGLTLTEVTHRPIHGGTIRAFFKKHGGVYIRWNEDELFNPETYYSFREKIPKKIAQFWAAYGTSQGTWAAFGAAAKGTVFACATNIPPYLFQYVVDETPEKQGKFTPYGTKIVPLSYLESSPVNNVWVFPWNFVEECRTKIPKGITVRSLI